MPVTLSFLSRHLVLSIRRFGLEATNRDTALIMDTKQWSLPSGADGEYCSEELHDLVACVASEHKAGVGPDVVWMLVADAEASGVWSAAEVAGTLTLFNRVNFSLHSRLVGSLLYPMGPWGTPSFCLLFYPREARDGCLGIRRT